MLNVINEYRELCNPALPKKGGKKIRVQYKREYKNTNNVE